MLSKRDLIDAVADEIVPIPAQYNEDLSLNVDKMCRHVDWLLEQDVKVFYLGLAASELEYMSYEERSSVVNAVGRKIDKQAVLMSQPVFTGSLQAHVDEAKMMMDAGSDVLVIKLPDLKTDQKIFSCWFRKNGFVKEHHQPYCVEYMSAMGAETDAPLILHDKPFRSFEYTETMMDLEHVVGLKTHEEDPFIRRTLYDHYGRDYICMDGMGKMYQFWSLVWGARSRHTNWSWFDPHSDKEFTAAVKSGRHQDAVRIVEREWPVVDAILSAGHHGYKVIMGLKGLPYSPVRNPGWIATNEEIQGVVDAAIRIGLVDESKRSSSLEV